MASHDWATFAEYVSARSAALHRAAYLMVGDVGLAQDLVQEALIRTYVAWSRLRDPANAEAYTRKAIATIAIDWSRRKARSAERPSDRPPDRTDPRPRRSGRRPYLAVAVPAAVAGPATGGDRAALLRGPHRGADRRGDGLRRRHREEHGLRRHGQVARTWSARPGAVSNLTRW